MSELDPDFYNHEVPPVSGLPAVYLLSLRIEGARCFGPAQTLSITRPSGDYAPWTVVLGENGTGKTTLLQSLAGMAPDLDMPRGSRQHPKWAGSGWSGFVTNLYDVHYPRVATPELRGDHMSIHLTFTIPSGPQQYILDMQTHRDGSRTSKLARMSPPAVARIFGYGASRTFGIASLQQDQPRGVVESLFDESVPLQNPEEWLLQTDYSARQEGERKETSRRQLAEVREALVRVLPDIDGVRISPPTEARKTARAEFHTPYGWVPLSGLGLGYRTMTAWMVDLASRLFDAYPDSSDPLAEPAVVLVDEIDLHMHPRWQRTIIDYLSERFPKTQFIVTAHSPLIVQSAKDANVVVLRRVENPEGDDYVVIDNDPEIVANWRVDQILTSLFDLETARPKEVEPLLKERRQILSKPKLSTRDKSRLRSLNREIGTMPTGESPEDIEAMDIIRRAAALLKDKEGNEA